MPLKIRRRIAWLLEYEPTWFPEFGSGLGILLWSLGCFLTDNIRISGWAWVMPTFGLVFGPFRWVLLWRLWYAPRVAAATLSGVFWAWILCALFGHFGAIPLQGPVIALLMMDFLTMGRFSLPCLRDLMAEWAERHAR